jgi:hypothetical protein
MEYFSNNELTDIKLGLNKIYAAPEFKTISNKKWIAYVDTDGMQYPEKLIYYKNNCALHNAIIKNVTRMYAGNGFEVAETADARY